jgi:hypothetical protein
MFSPPPPYQPMSELERMNFVKVRQFSFQIIFVVVLIILPSIVILSLYKNKLNV